MKRHPLSTSRSGGSRYMNATRRPATVIISVAKQAPRPGATGSMALSGMRKVFRELVTKSELNHTGQACSGLAGQEEGVGERLAVAPCRESRATFSEFIDKSVVVGFEPAEAAVPTLVGDFVCRVVQGDIAEERSVREQL